MLNRPRRGANALEFALVMTFVLVPLVLGAVEFAWYLTLRIAVDHCVADAVREAADTCNPGNCDALAGGECASCLNAANANPSTIGTGRFAQCWSETGYPGTASATSLREGTSLAGTRNRRITVTGSVTYTPLAVTSALPRPLTSHLTMRFDDQSF